MAGLIHPEDMERWEAWSRSRHRLRRAKHAVVSRAGAVRGAVSSHRGTDPSSDPAPPWVLRSRDGDGRGASARRLLIAVDSSTATSRASLLTSLLYQRAGIDVLVPEGVDLPETDDDGWSTRSLESPSQAVDGSTGAVVSIGQHLAAGAAAHRIARELDLPEFVVQHGVLTPFAPPLPAGATVLAWSAADAAFWSGARRDVSTLVVGSQLLWQSAHEAEAEPHDVDEVLETMRPVFLGQLHGAELPRRTTGAAAVRFCLEHDALYRPHPAETDALSRAQHRWWRRRGVEFEDSGAPLRELAHPVVSVFSTGLLEAAARGSRAWAYCPGAPAWVHELWERYGMRRFGEEPTPSPVTEAEEPAARIARLLEDAL